MIQLKDYGLSLTEINQKMKKILVIAFLAVFTISCAQKKVVEATYENGKPRVVKYYNKKAGELILEKEEVFYENQQKKMEGTYKNDLRNGSWKAWYEDGTLWSEGEYNNGKRSGLGIAYHENGKKYIEGMYREDARVGIWQFYDTSGMLIKEVNFDLVPKISENDTIN